MIGDPLRAIARHGRLVLVGGLVAGIVFPGPASHLAPWIEPMVALHMFIAALRIGLPAAWTPRALLPRYLGLTVALQTGMPLAALALLWSLGWHDSVVGIGVVLALAGAPIIGAPGLAILAGADPAPALRQLVLGSALLPLTALPLFWFLPVFGEPSDTLAAAGRLLALIAVSGGLGFWLRARLPALDRPQTMQALDGVMALAMAVLVIGLVSGLGPAIWSGQLAVWWIIALVTVLNFGSQLVVWAGARRGGAAGQAAPLGIVAGNRNMALFLGALPPELAADIMVFLGAYQVPMFLTPLVMIRLYRAVPTPAGGSGPAP